ncbi:MurR/RpiR family transcriptional regulator [Rhizobium sp. P40RR-XXII]|uniref:MurR/RpiR family transcriptional regulator n=1 Tax=Rhizobium sp. P40RR-XXII TaxID=2726739 RepID=UPI0014577F41|nr:MurR/RpiR family transcriptional regulator [Rhizobium sp. P40RR-XXII]NLS21139.1 MurR/RpiR family transcriptional regulator [Rhizobium sp. P40RR-XXII]
MAKSRSGKEAKDASGVEEKIDIEAILRGRMADLSPSEQSLAAYILDNIQILPFETGSSIAQAVGVSEMTVTRFVRGLGFENLRDLKKRLRVAVAEKDSEVDDYMARFQMREGREQMLQESLRLELDAIVKAYALTTTDLWDEAASLLVKARTIYVVGFQASKGLAMDFASRLLWARSNVIFIDNASGTFGEIINADPKQSAVVLVDTASYATRGIKLAEMLKSIDMPLVIVTDKFSHWAFVYTRFVFEAHTHVKTFWDSTASLSVVLNLLIDAVATKLGPKAKRNFAMMSNMGSLFGEFVGGSYLRRDE